MENSDKQLDNCNFSKMIMMLIIVFYHSMVFWTGKWFSVIGASVYEAKVLSVLSDYLAYIVNGTFILISGYIYYYIKIEKKRYDNYFKFIINKAKRLLIPYLFGMIFTLPFVEYFYKFNMKEIFVMYVLGKQPSHLWFLLCLFGIFAISFFCVRIWEKSDIIGIISIILMYVAGSAFSRIFGDYFQIPGILQFISLFFIGFKIRQDWWHKLERINIVVFFVIDIILYVLFRTTENMENEGIIYALSAYAFKYLHMLVGAISLFQFLQFVAGNINWHNKIFNTLIKYSMSIYIFHHPFVWVVLSLFNGKINPYIHMLLCFIISLTVSLVLSLIFFKTKFTRRLLGENK